MTKIKCNKFKEDLCEPLHYRATGRRQFTLYHKFSEIPSTNFIDLRRTKGWVDLGIVVDPVDPVVLIAELTQWYWLLVPLIGNAAPLLLGHVDIMKFGNSREKGSDVYSKFMLCHQKKPLQVT